MASKYVLMAVILWTTLSFSYGSWMYLGISPVKVKTSEECYNISGLIPEQISLCKKHPDFIQYVSEGANMAIKECQRVFEFERWNCSLSSDNSLFGPNIKKGTKETAFIHAIFSAGVTHSITKYLTSDTCYESQKAKKKSELGCKKQIRYAMDFSRRFVDATDSFKQIGERPFLSMLNIHNNEIGRRIIKKSIQRKCSCHGLYGACVSLKCWPKLPSFQSVGNSLKKKYDHAVSVPPFCDTEKCLKINQAYFDVRQEHTNPVKAVMFRVSKQKPQKTSLVQPVENKKIKKDDMIFVEKSVNFCDSNPQLGIIGTRGRKCKEDNCSHLCCGRGYMFEIVKRTESVCNCTFVWCCHVECQKCERSYKKHTCL